ncbi:hydroxylysine kinase [Chloropicon primus]|uniref:Hydroxylysine kinase n=1 Tax=Chloropicon primus TaxID=1764295 RepID=A0A5B8MV38_9CHLO|nr:hydroxylysine kinase [Chloropicon primus]UPR02482.1 hydroxylysine kinase [Chloropicon primus]|eukprot:QDZ23270.1 hydroxylysine kinase [Chloropicon primus]
MTTRRQDPVAEEMRRKDEKPSISIRKARELALEHFNLRGPHPLDRIFRFGRQATRIIPLNSYDDRNFLFYRKRMVKFYNGVESGHPAFIDAQGRAMARCKAGGILTNAPVLAKDGKDVVFVELVRKDEGSGELVTRKHAMRVLEFIPGKVLGDIEQTDDLLVQAGELIGRVDEVFQNFDHIGFHRNHLWDLKHSLKLREFVGHIRGGSRKELVVRVLQEFEDKVLPLSGKLRESVIHNDANDQNILADEKGKEVIGILDWGDMVKSWLVCEIAIAMAYVMLNKEDILKDASSLLKGYCKRVQLRECEVKVLRTLIACRLACSSTMSAYSASKDPDNKYLLLTQEPGWKALEAFMALPEDVVSKTFARAATA